MKTGFHPLNRLQPVTMAFLTLINKFSDTGKDKVNLVAILKKMKSSEAFLAKHSGFQGLITVVMLGEKIKIRRTTLRSSREPSWFPKV